MGDGIMSKKIKLKKLFINLEYIFSESVDIIGDDDNDISRTIRDAENTVLDELQYIEGADDCPIFNEK